jgi:hypothetical protein
VQADGLVLTLIVPEKRDAILARADDDAHNRLICGVHYHQDGPHKTLTKLQMSLELKWV